MDVLDYVARIIGTTHQVCANRFGGVFGTIFTIVFQIVTFPVVIIGVVLALLCKGLMRILGLSSEWNTAVSEIVSELEESN